MWETANIFSFSLQLWLLNWLSALWEEKLYHYKGFFSDFTKKIMKMKPRFLNFQSYFYYSVNPFNTSGVLRFYLCNAPFPIFLVSLSPCANNSLFVADFTQEPGYWPKCFQLPAALHQVLFRERIWQKFDQFSLNWFFFFSLLLVPNSWPQGRHTVITVLLVTKLISLIPNQHHLTWIFFFHF